MQPTSKFIACACGRLVVIRIIRYRLNPNISKCASPISRIPILPVIPTRLSDTTVIYREVCAVTPRKIGHSIHYHVRVRALLDENKVVVHAPSIRIAGETQPNNHHEHCKNPLEHNTTPLSGYPLLVLSPPPPEFCQAFCDEPHTTPTAPPFRAKLRIVRRATDSWRRTVVAWV